MEIINEYNKSTSKKNKSSIIKFNRINNRLNDAQKTYFKKLNNKSSNIFNMKYQTKNNLKFPKLSLLYSSSKHNLKLNFSKINSPSINNKNISYQDESPKMNIKELSAQIFQNNDIELVRNLNPDSNNDLIRNLLFKEHLKNKLESSQLNISKILKKEKEGKEEVVKKIENEKNFYKNEVEKLLKNKIIKLNRTNLVEQELNEKLKSIEENYQDKKMKKIKINNDFKQILKEIDNIGYELYFLNKNSLKSSKLNESIKLKEKKIINKRNNTKSNQESPIPSNEKIIPENNKNLEKKEASSKRDFLSYVKIQKKKDFEKQSKQNKIKELKIDLKELKQPLKFINNEINELRNIEKDTKDKLMRHYLELLYYGKEVRNEGLIWIIKKIWKMGQNVPMSFMPTFLDIDAIKYLFNMAKLSIELESTKKYILDLKLKLKEKINNMKISKKNNSSIIAKQNFNAININNKPIKSKNNFSNHSNILKKKLLNSSSSPCFKKIFLKLDNRLNMSEEKEEEFKGSIMEISKILEEKEKNLSLKKIPELNEIKNMREKIKSLEEKIEEIKNKEIYRIFREYIDNDYERLYHAPIDVVLGALLGEHNRNIQINNFDTFKKGYFDGLKKIRFYENEKKKI